MAITAYIVLFAVISAGAMAAPTSEADKIETTTVSVTDDGPAVFGVIEIIDEVPQVVLYVEAPTTTEAPHKVAKRSAIDGERISNDLLADFGANYDGISSLDGRRIKILPTWIG